MTKLQFLWIQSWVWGLFLVTSGPLSLAQTPATAVREARLDPIISHTHSARIPRLLLISALEVETRKLTAADEAELLYKNTQRAISDLDDAGPSIAISNNLSKDAAALVLYYLAQSTASDREERLQESARWLATYSQAYADASKQTLLRTKALYHNALARYLLSNGTEGIPLLVPLREPLTAERAMIANIDLMVGYSLALTPATASQGFRMMTQATQRVSVYGRVAQRLTEAWVEYGLDAEGKLGKPAMASKTATENKITYSIQIARGMPPGAQHLVMDSIIFIWDKALGSQGNETPNYLIEGFPGILPVEALREREALRFLRELNHPGSLAIYRTIGASFESQPLGLQIDRRIWQIELLQYRRTNQIADLEAAFGTVRERYFSSRKKRSTEGTSFYGEVLVSYRGVLDALLNQALQAQAAVPLRNAAIQTSMRYIKLETDRQQSYPLKAKVAQLFRLMNMFREAVDMYLDLAKDQPMRNFLLAIEAQSQLAKWPTQPPFEGAPAADNAERSRLLSIYETVSELKQGEDWFMLAHIGLLYRSLGQVQKAEDFWLAALKTNMKSKFALEAGGVLLTEFYGNKRWQAVIDLVHLFQSRKLVPAAKGLPIAYLPWMADALYNGGHADLQAKNFARSVKHLEEFTTTFGSDPRAAQATYSTAFGYMGLNKLVPALNACRTVVEQFPQFQLRNQVMLQGAEWATNDQKTWEFAFFFYTRYLSEFKSESNVPQIRVRLAELYIKRKLYGWASRLYKEQSLSPNVPQAMQLQAAIKHMEIEEQFGEAKEAFWGAQRVAQLSTPEDPAMIRALAFQGRYVANNKDLKGMAEVEPKLIPHTKTSKEALEAVGFLRFRRAELLTQEIVYTENTLQLQDLEGTVKKYFERFEAEKQHYQRVCQIGVTSFCAPALLRLMTVAEQGIAAVEKVEIADTLGPNRVNSFNVFKKLHITKIQKARKEFGEQALKLAQQGTTTQIWKDEIIKTLELEKDLSITH